MKNDETTGAEYQQRSGHIAELRKNALFMWAAFTISLTLISGLDAFIELAGIGKAIAENWAAGVRSVARNLRSALPFTVSDSVVASSFAWTGSIAFYLSCRRGWAFSKFARRSDGRMFRLNTYLRRPWIFFRATMPWVPGFIILFGMHFIAVNSFGLAPGELDNMSQWKWEFTNLFLMISAVLMLCMEMDWKRFFWRAFTILTVVLVISMSGHIQQLLWRFDEVVEEYAEPPADGP